jgi:hypothetical protein
MITKCPYHRTRNHLQERCIRYPKPNKALDRYVREKLTEGIHTVILIGMRVSYTVRAKEGWVAEIVH